MKKIDPETLAELTHLAYELFVAGIPPHEALEILRAHAEAAAPAEDEAEAENAIKH